MISVSSIRHSCWLILLLGLFSAVMGCETMPFEPHYPPPPPAPVVIPPTPSPPSRPVFYVNASRLNLRACPGMDCPKVSSLERNEKVEVVAEAEDWTQVRVKRDGAIGWVASQYLSKKPVPGEPLPSAGELPTPEVAEPGKPEPAKPVETTLPRVAPKPAEAAEPEAPATPPGLPEPAVEEPAPVKEPPPEVEKPAPATPEPAPEPPKRIRIM
jgi:hypothetical protein